MSTTQQMRVTVIDRGDPKHGYQGIRLRTVLISGHCPECGGPRGEPYPYRFCEDGEWFTVSRWDNSCGHLDYYDAVLREATL